ncbi:IclR family transcriptional regulator [Blastococcus saxobsidens]|uniref:IclR family transcriptional regulator n=1 Tax=Blastococcus saxobsidens TaxID=138336 RepID=A0A4Q7Y8Q5_9ACTN|nr:IclR family transcriptional regulator [Blastococcus saxobsidens]RZU32429.1 IclR family transcriptional regulator [Blastococcus saxobsidens]
MENPVSDRAGLRSVDNALRLLDLIGERQVLRVAEAADALGVAGSTAHRLLTALRQRGFVLQDKPHSAYRPGPALNAIGLAAIGRIDIRRVARPILEDLAESTQETVSLCLLEGRSVRFIDCVESPRPVRVGDRTGVVMPAHCTAAGKAILAGMSPGGLRRLYPDGELGGLTDASITRLDALLDELQTIRDSGYAINIEEGENGISAVGTSVPDPHGTPLVALAVVVPSGRLPDASAGRTLAPMLLEARDQITRSLHTAT